MKKLISLLLMLSFLFLVACGTSDNAQGNEGVDTSAEETSDQSGAESSTSGEGEDTSDNVEVEESSTSSEEEELTQAFIEYVDFVIEIAPEEDRLIMIYDGATGNNYTDDETLYYVLIDELIPGYRNFVNDMEDFMPRNRVIRDIHEDYIQAVNVQFGAFTLMISALEEGNYETITEANQHLDEARRIMRNWIYDMEDLSDMTGVSLE